jgi:hypothetical protein
MQQEKTSIPPAANILRPEAKQDQANYHSITKVFMQNGTEYDIIPGSFKFFLTTGDRPQPYVQFKTILSHVEKEIVTGININRELALKLHTLQFWPVAIAGWAFLDDDAESDQ